MEKPEKELNETELSNLPDKEVEVMAIKMFTRLEVRVDAPSEDLYKEINTIKKNQSEMKNTKMN